MIARAGPLHPQLPADDFGSSRVGPIAVPSSRRPPTMIGTLPPLAVEITVNDRLSVPSSDDPKV